MPTVSVIAAISSAAPRWLRAGPATAARTTISVPVAARNPGRTLRLRQQLTTSHRPPTAIASPAAVSAAPSPQPARSQPRTLTARATTSRTVISAISDCVAIRSFARGLSGSVSVGLNAVAFVYDM